MTVIGFNFTKVSAERFTASSRKIQVTNNISIKGIKESKIAADEKRSTIRISFGFVTNYEPQVASINLEGDLLLLLPRKEADELVVGWREKKIKTETLLSAMSHALERCSIQGIILSRDLNLPSPVQMPRVQVETIGKKAEAKSASGAKEDKK